MVVVLACCRRERRGKREFFPPFYVNLNPTPSRPLQHSTTTCTMAFPQHLFRRHASNRIRDDSNNNNSSSDNPDESQAVNDDSPPPNNSPTSTTQDDEEDNILIVPIPSNAPHLLPQANLTFPPQQTSQQHRLSILAEVERVQRANFIHFALLCLVPTSLLLIVVAAIVSEDEECNGMEGVTICEREARSFVNAFTTRCVCDAVRSVSGEGGTDDAGLF